MIRDVIAGQAIGRTIPAFFTDMNLEILVCVVTAVIVFVLAACFKQKYVDKEASVDKINNVLDALGIGVFAAAGDCVSRRAVPVCVQLQVRAALRWPLGVRLEVQGRGRRNGVRGAGQTFARLAEPSGDGRPDACRRCVLEDAA